MAKKLFISGRISGNKYYKAEFENAKWYYENVLSLFFPEQWLKTIARRVFHHLFSLSKIPLFQGRFAFPVCCFYTV